MKNVNRIYAYPAYAKKGDPCVAKAMVVTSGDTNFLCDFVVKDTERGQGIGTRLLEMLMDQFDINCLTVEKDNAIAKHMYEKAGFNPDEDVDITLVNPSVNHDQHCIYMTSGPLSDDAKKALSMLLNKVTMKLFKSVYVNKYNASDLDVDALVNELVPWFILQVEPVLVAVV